MSSVLQRLAAKTGANKATIEAPSSLLDFLEREVETDYGPWSIKGHEPLLELIQLVERIVVEQEANTQVTAIKCEQSGVTTCMLAASAWIAASQHYNVGYFLPTDELASEFGQAKLNPVVDNSPYLRQVAADGNVERGVLKDFAGKFIYLLGLNKVSGATTRPMDLQVSDEVDLTSERMRRWKRGRMRHSKLRCEVDFSAPYAENSGIDARFQKGSQRRWLVSCVACGRADICLEESFPECMRHHDGHWVRVCPSCHQRIDFAGKGRWVATYPEREIATATEPARYSYRLSAFAIGAIDGDEIMASYHEALESGDPDSMAIFNRSARAMADAGAMQPIDDTALKAMERDYALVVERGEHPVYFGADAGNACWAWFEERLPDGRPRLLWAEKLNSDRWVERMEELIAIFRPRFGVVDKKPLLTDSRRLAYGHPLRLALLDFDHGKELAPPIRERFSVDDTAGGANQETGPEYYCIKIDRDLALGKFVGYATNSDHGLILPADRGKTMQLVRAHLKKLQRIQTHDAKGNELYKFVDKVENHFGMAAMAAHLAWLTAPMIEEYGALPWPKESRRAQLSAMDRDGDEDERPRARRSQLRRLA